MAISKIILYLYRFSVIFFIFRQRCFREIFLTFKNFITKSGVKRILNGVFKFFQLILFIFHRNRKFKSVRVQYQSRFHSAILFVFCINRFIESEKCFLLTGSKYLFTRPICEHILYVITYFITNQATFLLIPRALLRETRGVFIRT